MAFQDPFKPTNNQAPGTAGTNQSTGFTNPFTKPLKSGQPQTTTTSFSTLNQTLSAQAKPAKKPVSAPTPTPVVNPIQAIGQNKVFQDVTSALGKAENNAVEQIRGLFTPKGGQTQEIKPVPTPTSQIKLNPQQLQQVGNLQVGQKLPGFTPTPTAAPSAQLKPAKAGQDNIIDNLFHAPDHIITSIQDYLAQPENAKIAEPLAQVQKKVVEPFMQNRVARPIVKGITETYLGDSKKTMDLFNTPLDKPTTFGGKAYNTVGEIAGQVAAFIGGGAVLKGIGLGRAAMPALFALVGQTSAPVSTTAQQRLEKLPADAFAGWLLNYIPETKQLLSPQMLKNLGLTGGILGTNTLIDGLIAGLPPKDAAAAAAKMFVIGALFHIAGTATGLFAGEALKSEFREGTAEFTPDQARGAVIGSNLENTPVGNAIMKASLDAESQGKNLKIDMGAAKESPTAGVIKKFTGLQTPHGVRINNIELVEPGSTVNKIGTVETPNEEGVGPVAPSEPGGKPAAPAGAVTQTWPDFEQQREHTLATTQIENPQGASEGTALEPQVSAAVTRLNELGHPTTSSGFVGEGSALALANNNQPTHSIDGELNLSPQQITAINASGLGKAVNLKNFAPGYQAILVNGNKDLNIVKNNFNKIVDIIGNQKLAKLSDLVRANQRGSAGLDLEKIKTEFPSSTENPLYEAMTKAQDRMLAETEKLKQYKTEAEIPAKTKANLNKLKQTWQSKVKAWEAVYVKAKAKIASTNKVAASDQAIEEYVKSKETKFRVPNPSGLILGKPERQVTSKFLEHPDIKGRESASYQYLLNLSNSTSFGLKNQEREIIQEVLNMPEFKNQKQINMTDFRNTVIGNLLPLEIIKTNTYASYGADNLGLDLNSGGATTYLLNSNFEHGNTGHFPSDFDKTIDRADIEIREIPVQPQNPTAKFAVVRKGVELTEENIEQNVYNLTSTQAEAEAWIDSHTTNELNPGGESTRHVAVGSKKGLFGHFRTFDETAAMVSEGYEPPVNLSHIAEIQSDPYQKSMEQITTGGKIAQLERNIERSTTSKSELEDFIVMQKTTIEDWAKMQNLVHSKDFAKKKDLTNSDMLDDYKLTAISKREGISPSIIDNLLSYTINEKFNKKYALERIAYKLQGAKDKLSSLKETMERDTKTFEDYKAQLTKLQTVEVAKTEKLFMGYKNIWPERMVREAIYTKATEGFKTLRFPMPRTVAIIEGFVSGNGDNAMPYEVYSAEDHMRLGVGDTIEYGGERMTVLEADNYNITVANSDGVRHFNADLARDEDVEANWEEAVAGFEGVEKDFGTVDTAEKAEAVIDAVNIANRLSKFNSKATDIAGWQNRFEHDNNRLAAISSLAKDTERLENYRKFEKLLKSGIVKKGHLTLVNLENREFKDGLEKKYGVPHAFWNFILDNWRFTEPLPQTEKSVTNRTLKEIEPIMIDIAADIADTNIKLQQGEAELAQNIKEVEARTAPTPQQLKTLPKSVLADAKNSQYGYSLDYQVENLLEHMTQQPEDETFGIDDLKDAITQQMYNNYEPDFEGSYGEGHVFYEGDEVWITEHVTESFQQPDEYEEASSIEDFNIDNFSGSQGTVLQFYDKQINRYLEKLRQDNLKLVTDDSGNEWLETQVTKQDLEPPTAYRLKDSLTKAGLPITDKQEQEITKLNEQIFGDTNVEITGQILANDSALGSYKSRIIKILDGQANAKETFYHEAVHKYLDVFTSKDEHIEILKEAQAKYQLGSIAEVEEKLAEDFINYAKDKESATGRIKSFFDLLLKRLKEFFNGKSRIDALYNDIVSGKAAGGNLGFKPKNLEEPFSDKATTELEKITKQSDIAQGLSEKLGVPIRRGKFKHPGAIGVYKPNPKVVRIKSGALNTIFHEVGHFLDDTIGFSKDINVTERKDLMKEYGHDYANQPEKQRKEAFAEYLRYNLTGQTEKITKNAPEFDKAFNEKIGIMPEVKTVLDTARTDYTRWQEQSPSAKILSHLSVGKQKQTPFKDKVTQTLHDVYTSALDDLHPLSEFSALANKKLGKVSAEKDPYVLARNLRGWVGKADLFLNKGTFGKDYWTTDAKGKTKIVYKGKGYSEIMRPVEKKGNLDDFRVFLTAQRIVNDLAPRNIKTGIALSDAKAALEEQTTKHPEFEKVAEERRLYKDHLLEFARDNGIVGDEGLRRIKELNKFHVPFYRVLEESQTKFLGKTKIGGNIGNPIKRIKGSELEIIDPLESDVKDTYAIINAAERNNIGIAMANLAKQNFELGRIFEEVARPMQPVTVDVQEVLKKALVGTDLTTDDLPEELGKSLVTLFRSTYSTAPNTLNINMGDTQKVFEVDPDLFKAMQGLNVEDIATIFKILAIPAKTLRAGATLSPDFSVRNPIRDQFTAFVYSKYGFMPGVDLVRGMFELFKQGDTYDLWKAAGGEHAMFVSLDRTALQKNFKEVFEGKGSKGLNLLKSPIEILRLVSELGEAGTRLGEMRNALSRGENPVESAFAARNVTLDFARMGARTKAWNAVDAFFSANLNGTDTMIRNFKNRPFQTLWKVLLGITLPSILLYLANRKDPRWKEIPAWQKDLFWIILTPNHIFRIPKPFELGVIFGSVPERIMEVMDSHDPALFNELENSIAQGFTPGFLPTALIPIIENITNYSLFLNRPIVSQGKEGLPPPQQSGTYTSETAKLMGQALNYSPAKIDNLIYGYTGGLGRYATSGLDGILKGSGVVKVPPTPAQGLEDQPVVKAYMIRPPVGTSSESVNRVYNLYQTTNAQLTYAKQLLKSGKGEEAKAYIKAHPDTLNAVILGTVTSSFSQMNKAVDDVRLSPKLNAQEKAKKILQIQTLETKLAERALHAITNKK